MSSVFEACEKLYCQLSANLSKKCASANLLDGGKDATDDFEDVGHSSTARAKLDEYYVGDIDSSSIPSKASTTSAPPKQALANQDQSSGFVIKLLQFLVPLFILGVPVGVRFYTKLA